MRLKNIYFTCKHCLAAIDDIAPRAEKQNVSVGSPIAVSVYKDWYVAKRALCELLGIDFLRPHIDAINAASEHNVKGSDLRLLADSAEAQSVSGSLSTIKWLVRATVSIGDSVGYGAFGESAPGFDVKLPDGIAFDELIKCLTDLNKVFQQCSYLKTDAVVRFASLDAGSSWLNFVVEEAPQAAGVAVATVSAAIFLKKLGDIVYKAVEIRNLKIQGDMQLEQMRKLSIDNDNLQRQKETNSVIHKALVAKVLKDLDKEHSGGANPDPEQQIRNATALCKLADWLERGMVILSSIDNDESVKGAFPKNEQQAIMAKDTKLIESPNNDGA
jgi:hypothetical protein